jgi:hypothetical protein
MSGWRGSRMLGSMKTTNTQERPDATRFWRHAGGLTVAGVLIALALGAAFMSIGSSQEPRDLPIAAVGTPEMARALESKAPGELSVRAVSDVAAARQAIAERDVYGAVVPGPTGVRELMVAPAANLSVSNFLRRTLGHATPENVPRITDVAPLPDEDASGVDVALLLQILLIGGSIAVVGFAKVVPRFQGSPRRGVLPLASLVGYALAFGLVLTGIAAAFGVGSDAAFLDTFLAFSLISLAVAASAAALVALIGPAGSAVAAVVYFVLGAQISGAGAAPEFLAPVWSEIGQALPAGAGTSLLRNVFYFPEASSGGAIATLGAYAVAGFAVLLALNLVLTRRRAPAAVPVTA